jgi:hypothetical protein
VATKPEAKSKESSKQERNWLKRLGDFGKAAQKFRRVGGASDAPATPRTPFNS